MRSGEIKPAPLVIAHRGASGDEPENTLLAFEAAIVQGAQMIELDLQATADGHVVVIHDDYLGRTTDRRGRVSRKTLAEVREADAGKGERIPTLDETLNLAHGRVELYLEIKNARAATTIVTQVRAHGLASDVLVASFDLSLMRELRREVTDMRVGVIVGVPAVNPLALSGRLNFDVISLETRLCQAVLVQRIQSTGKKVYAWTANDERTYGRLVARGVDGIVTNHPGKLAQYLVARS